ncbi:MAG TPA: hypothetical protein VGD65_24925 [Chryseosolibacter sp.]
MAFEFPPGDKPGKPGKEDWHSSKFVYKGNNNQDGRAGSLFQAKFQAIEIGHIQRAINCFNYILGIRVKATFGFCTKTLEIF